MFKYFVAGSLGCRMIHARYILHKRHRDRKSTGENRPLISPDSVFRRADDIKFRRIGDEGIAVRQQAGEVLVLNEIGHLVLELADGTRPVSQLVEAIADRYDSDAETIRRDLYIYLERLVENAVIVESPAPST